MGIRVDKQGFITTLTLDRPDVHNCLNIETLLQLSELMDQLRFDSSTRVVVITGAGEKAFCAGADLKERRGMSEAEVKQYVFLISQTFSKVEKLPQPVIAAINGVAFGGGMELALACDLRIMADTAMMGLTETSLGIIPGAGGTQRLPRIVGITKAKEWIYTAKRISSQEAERYGMVNDVVSSSEVLERALSLAEEINAQAPLAIIQAKYALSASSNVDMETGMNVEANAYQLLIPTEDRLEGLQAFEEKRKPLYKGR